MKTVLVVIALCFSVVGQAAYSGSGTYSGSAVSGVGSSSGSTINAASCSAADVQAAFSAATAATTAINIPAGTCHWTTQATLTVNSSSTTLSILGAGSLTTTGGGDATVIIDDYNSGNALIDTTTAGSSSIFRLAGITVQGGSGGGSGNPKYGLVRIHGLSHNVRFDHNHLNAITYSPGESGAQLRFGGWIEGVTDHNILDLTTLNGTVNGIWTWDDAYNGETSGTGDNSWADATNLGSSHFMFEEDNVVSGGVINDCTHGGRVVARHNTLNNGASFETHPTGGGGRARGCRAWEFYQNTLSGSMGTPEFNGFFLSSGTGVMWGNTASTGYEYLITLHSVRRDNSVYGQSATPAGWGYCGTSFNGTGSNWDQNTSGTTGYACIDQPGRGQGDQLSGDFPSAINTTTGTIAWLHEVLEPVYEWQDTFTPAPGYCAPGSGNAGCVANNYNSDVLVRNQDYYVWCNASSPTGCASFTGTAGVGSGLLSARPSTCTPLVGYWATDTSTLYQCSSTNSWTTYYTPYTYPHPLQGFTP